MEDLARLVSVLEGGSGVAWDNGGVVEEVEEAAAVAGEENLLLGALDDGGEVDVIGFFQLLTSLFLYRQLIWPCHLQSARGLTMLVS